MQSAFLWYLSEFVLLAPAGVLEALDVLRDLVEDVELAQVTFFVEAHDANVLADRQGLHGLGHLDGDSLLDQSGGNAAR
jgi:hypothetical protein